MTLKDSVHGWITRKRAQHQCECVDGGNKDKKDSPRMNHVVVSGAPMLVS